MAVQIPQRFRSKVVRSFGVLLFVALPLAACSSDSSKTTPAAVTEASTETEAPDTAVAETEAVPTEAAEAVSTEAAEAVPTEAAETEAAADSLAAESATCTAFAKVKELNDRGGALTSEFQSQLVAGAGESPDKAAKAWETFQKKFAADSEVVLPELKDAYATLAKEQPAYAKDFDNLNEVTADLLTFFTTIKFEELDKLEIKLAEAVSTEKTVAAGESSLKIDKFSKSACGIPFANT
jgi:hypothetical protein